MKRAFLTKPTIRLFTIIAVLSAFVLAVYSMSGLPRPREVNRVQVGNDAFSIIKPAGWDQKIVYKTDGVAVEFSPVQSYGRWETFNAARIAAPTTQKLSAMNESEFQGQKAWAEGKQLKWEFYWHTIFQRGDYWYDLALHLRLLEDVPRSQWWAYLNSFKSGNGPSTLPSQQPGQVSPVATTIPSGFGNVP